VERLLTVRERLHATTPQLRLTMVLMRQNLRELPDLIHLASQWGIEELFVQHLCHDFGEASLPERYRPMRAFVDEQTLLHEDPEVVTTAFGQARELAHALGVDLRLPRAQPRAHPSGTPGRQRCDWPWRGAYISYDGHAMPCCMVSTPDRINFGKVVEGDVAALWNGPEYQAFRTRLDSDDPPDVCQSCAVYAGIF
jgi:radical SAM protein with 4Fe4S-binding SPASM domain